MLAQNTSNALLNAFFAREINGDITTSRTCWLGFSTTVPTVGDTITGFTEPDESTGYERCLLGNYQQTDTQLMDAASGGTIKNGKHKIYAFIAKAAIGPFKYMGLFSSKEGGAPIMAGALTSEVSVPADSVMLFDLNGLQVSMA